MNTNEEMEWSTDRSKNSGKRKIDRDPENRNAKISIIEKKEDANVGDAIVTNVQRNEEVIKYQLNNAGPYKVWIFSTLSKEKIPMNRNISSLSAFKIGKILGDNYKSIKYIRMISRNKEEIEFKDRIEANKIIKDPE